MESAGIRRCRPLSALTIGAGRSGPDRRCPRATRAPALGAAHRRQEEARRQVQGSVGCHPHPPPKSASHHQRRGLAGGWPGPAAALSSFGRPGLGGGKMLAHRLPLPTTTTAHDFRTVGSSTPWRPAAACPAIGRHEHWKLALGPVHVPRRECEDGDPCGPVDLASVSCVPRTGGSNGSVAGWEADHHKPGSWTAAKKGIGRLESGSKVAARNISKF